MVAHDATIQMATSEISPTILVVDDDPMCRALLTGFLDAKGYHVIEASNGQEAWQMLQKGDISLVVSDIDMPLLTGVELLTEVARQRLNVPVILVTGRASVDAAVECMKIGAIGYLAKPFEGAKLFRLVEEGIRRRKQDSAGWHLGFPDGEGPEGYTFDKLLGEGACGVVFLVHKGEHPYALKVIKAIGLSEAQRLAASERFLHECKALSVVRHPSIIAFHEYGLAGASKIPYLIMEYFPSDAWETLVKQPLRVRLEMLLQAARGLEAIHAAGFCHRDIKPGNFLIGVEQKQLKWSDFGLVRLPESEITIPGQIMGSPGYMAPEAFESSQVDSRADIFSFGVVAYELFTGEIAFKGETIQQLAVAITKRLPIEPRKINPEIPPRLQDSLGDMLCKTVSGRVQTIGEVIREWEYCLGKGWDEPSRAESFSSRLLTLVKPRRRDWI
jgi:CheY-like chemotaxis protein